MKNYLKNLLPYYQETFVQLINEPIFFQKSGVITEKFLHSMLGCNFPILLAPEYSVKFLKDLGYDVFEDVVNHEYDSESEPLKRLTKAILDNKHLFFDQAYVIDTWKSMSQRFKNNVYHFRNRVKNNHLDLTKKFQEILAKITAKVNS